MRYQIGSGLGVTLVCRFELRLFVGRMASSSAPGSRLAELEQKLQGLEDQKAAELRKTKGIRDQEVLMELNKDLDRVQAAITALSSSELYCSVSTSASHSSMVWCGRV